MPNHAKNVQTVICTEIIKKSQLERPFEAINRYFFDFWTPSGSPGASQDMTGASQNSSFFHESLDASQNQPGGLPEGLKEGPRVALGVTQGSPGPHFGSLWDRRCTP